MRWLELFLGSRTEQLLTDISEQIALHIRHVIWQRVGQQIALMPAAETRGYIRARSSMIIDRKVAQFMNEDQRLSATQKDRLVELTTHAVTRLIERQSRLVRTPGEASQRVA